MSERLISLGSDWTFAGNDLDGFCFGCESVPHPAKTSGNENISPMSGLLSIDVLVLSLTDGFFSRWRGNDPPADGAIKFGKGSPQVRQQFQLANS